MHWWRFGVGITLVVVGAFLQLRVVPRRKAASTEQQGQRSWFGLAAYAITFIGMFLAISALTA